MGKLLILAGLGQSLYGRWLLRRLLASVIVLMGLVIIISMMAGAMLIGGFYAAYLALLSAGLEPKAAVIVTGCALVSGTLLLAFLVTGHLRSLRKVPLRLLSGKTAQATQANAVIDAFIEGLTGEPVDDTQME